MQKRIRAVFEALEMLHDPQGGLFQERVLKCCGHLFPEASNSYELWNRTDGSHEGAMNVPYDTKDIEERFRLIGELAPKQNPIFPHLVAGEVEPLRLSDLTTLREIQRTEFFDVVFKPADLRHQVAIPVQTETHVGGITFNKGGSRDFSGTDLEVIRLMARHIELAHRTEKVLEAALPQKAIIEATDFTRLRRAGFTRKECEVFHWMEQGKTDKEISIILGNSPRTISQHVRSILRKLGVENRTAAVTSIQQR